MKKRYLGNSLLALAIAATVITGCGQSNSAGSPMADVATESAYDAAGDYGLYESKAFTEEAEYVEEPAESSAEQVTDTSRKLITTVSMDAETENLDETIAKVEAKIKELGGYVESSNIYNGSGYSSKASRSAFMSVRIPQQKLDEFVASVEGSNNITSKSVNVDDVTLTYVDIDSRKKALKTEESRLLDILNNAETIEDLIAVEDRLSEVRYEIESIESQLRSYDNLVSYSTVNLSINEVVKFTPVEKEGAFARMGKGFMDSLESVGNGIVEFFVWLVSHLPQILIFAIVVALIVFIIKKIVKKSEKKRAAKMAQMQQAYRAAAPVYQAPSQGAPLNNAPVQQSENKENEGQK